MANLQILQNGRIRANFPVDPNTVYNQGQAIVVSPAGTLMIYNGSDQQIIGLAMETAVTATQGNPTANTSIVVQGQTGSILLGEALVTDNQVSGTGGWVIGGTVYAQSGGLLTYTNTSGTDIGRVTSTPASNGVLGFLFRPSI